MNISNYLVIKIKTTSPYKVVKLLRKLNINLYNINIYKESINLKINSADLEKISKFYKYEIIRYIGIPFIKNNIKKIMFSTIFIVTILLIIFLMSNIIIKINILSEDIHIKKQIMNYLENNNIKPYTIAKSSHQIDNLKINLKNELSDAIEWINISRKGMTYEIEYQEKKQVTPITTNDRCNIIAKKEGNISRIISEKGETLVDINDHVKKDDILISGEIKLNEEVKGAICAKGKVIAKTWYTINITIPKKYDVVEKLDKSRYNIQISHNGKNTKLFKNRLNDFETEEVTSFKIFSYKMSLLKDYEISSKTEYYTEYELNNKLNELVIEHMKPIIGNEGKIYKQNVLKKIENDSTIDIELFIVAEEEIGIESAF